MRSGRKNGGCDDLHQLPLPVHASSNNSTGQTAAFTRYYARTNITGAPGAENALVAKMALGLTSVDISGILLLS